MSHGTVRRPPFARAVPRLGNALSARGPGCRVVTADVESAVQGLRRGVEVRPSWSAREWPAVAAAARSAGLPPASWAAAAVTCGVDPDGAGPPRCTRRGVLWGQVLERWQSIYWGLVALRPRAPSQDWAQVSDVVGRVGLLITREADRVPADEARRATRACRAAATALGDVEAAERRRAVRGTRPAGEERGHRAKLMLSSPAHVRLRDRAAADGWAAGEYAAALSATAACLAVADARAAAETALLDGVLPVVRSAADLVGGLLASTGPLSPEAWARMAGLLREAAADLDRARATRGTADRAEDLAALAPRVFVTLGWAAPAGVSGS